MRVVSSSIPVRRVRSSFKFQCSIRAGGFDLDCQISAEVVY